MFSSDHNVRMTLQTLFRHLVWTGLSPLRKKRGCNMVSTAPQTPAPNLCSNHELVILKKVRMGITNTFLPSSSILCRWQEHTCPLVLILRIVWPDFSEPPCLWWQLASQASDLGNQGSTLETMHCTCLGQLVGTKLGRLTCLSLSCGSNLMCVMLLYRKAWCCWKAGLLSWGAVWPCMWETMGDGVWLRRIKC